MTLNWEFIIDWDNDGNLEASEQEEDRLRSVVINRGRPGLFVPGAAGTTRIGRMNVGTLLAVMDNNDQRYDPWHASSPLYPNVKPGRLARLRCEYSSTWYDMFKGYLDEPDSRGHKVDKIATMTIVDGWRILSERPVRELALQEDQLTHAIMSALLTAIDWPSALGSDLSVGSDIIPFFWGGGATAYDLLHELAESEFGWVYVPGDGKLHFVSRHAGYGLEPLTTITDDEVAGDPIIEAPWDSVRNYISITARVLTEQSSGAEVWRLRETPQVLPGQPITLWALLLDSFSRPSPAKGIRLDATTDWTANTQPGGGGADITGSFSVVKTDYGSLVKIVITNNYAIAGYIDYMRIWATTPIELLATSEWIEEDPTSQANYERRDFIVDRNPWIQDGLLAKAYAEWIASWATDPRPSISLMLEQRPALQLSLDVGDVITYNSAKLGINEDFRIGQIRHRTGVTPQQLFTEIVLEPFEAISQFWLLNVVGRSEVNETTYLAY